MILVPDHVPLVAADGLIIGAVAAIQSDAVDWEEELPVWPCYSDWCFVCYHTTKFQLWRMYRFSLYTLNLIGVVGLFYQVAQ